MADEFQSVNERLSQAQKVQQLLSALSSSQAPPPPPPPSFLLPPVKQEFPEISPIPLAAPSEVQKLLALLVSSLGRFKSMRADSYTIGTNE